MTVETFSPAHLAILGAVPAVAWALTALARRRQLAAVEQEDGVDEGAARHQGRDVVAA